MFEHIRFIRWAVVVALCAQAGCLHGGPVDDSAPNLERRIIPVFRTTGPIRIDGRIDEPDWQRAVSLKLRRHWEGHAARTPGIAWVTWDDGFVYVAGQFTDRDLFINREETQGRTWLSDVFEVFLKPYEEDLLRYEAHVTPDMQMLKVIHRGGPPSAIEDMERWDSAIVAAVSLKGSIEHGRRDAGWSVEMAIPWSDMAEGFAPEFGDRWQFAICRYDWSTRSDEPNHSATAPFRKLGFHRTQDYDWIEFVEFTADDATVAIQPPAKPRRR